MVDQCRRARSEQGADDVHVTMARPSLPGRRLSGYVQRVRSDSLVRNSLYLMCSTIMTAGLGYVFWALAAHAFTSQEVGIGSAVISLCSTTALLTYLGSSATLIERLPARERSSEWTMALVRVSLPTAGVTALVTAAAVVLLSSRDYRLYFSGPLPVFVAIIGAVSWTLVNLIGSAFVAARRAGRLLTIQTLISVAKILFVVELAATRAGATGLVNAWAASAVLGVGLGVAWLVPGMGLGRRPGPRTRRRPATTADFRRRRYRRPSHRRPATPPSARSVRHLLGQHLTSVGGAVTPLVLPVLVVVRLGGAQNAYFYITWMMGAAFFMVSPSVAQAVFAEGVRAGSDLRSVVAKALRIIAVLLFPAMVVMIVGGRLILRLFGTPYAAAGYGLLILLAISAVPDAVSNVAVAVCRVTRRLGYSSALNVGILVTTLTGAWVLMPRMGIAGVGAAWLGAQILGAIASLPAYSRIRRPAQLGDLIPGSGADMAAGPDPGPGLAHLVDLAKLQSLEKLGDRLP
jgi:O-antigen/teichoic acid export membrane protein